MKCQFRQNPSLFFLFLCMSLLSIFAQAQQSPSCTPPPPGMTGWWTGDGTYKDLVAGNDGSPIGKLLFGNGVVGQAFIFDGTNFIKVVDITCAKRLSLNTGGITLDAWIIAPPYKGVPDGSGTIVAKTNPSYPFQGYFLRVSDDSRVEFGATDCGTHACGFCDQPGCQYPKQPIRSNTVVADSTPHHVVGIRRHNGVREIWVDGKLENTRVESNWNTDSEYPLYIGDLNGVAEIYRLVGVADEIEVFNRALTPDEILAIYNAGPAGKCRPRPTPRN